MKKFGRLAAVVCLTLTFGLVALGGETQTPPCSNDPGETQTPPCSSAQFSSDNGSQTEVQTAQASDSTDYAVTEAALDIVQNVLSLF